MRNIHSIKHNIKRSVSWYGQEYTFNRQMLDEYGEPGDEMLEVQTLKGIYHASAHEFINLIMSDGATVKSKINKGIMCDSDTKIALLQDDKVTIDGVEHSVTAVEPILYGEEPIAQEISLEEIIDHGN